MKWVLMIVPIDDRSTLTATGLRATHYVSRWQIGGTLSMRGIVSL